MNKYLIILLFFILAFGTRAYSEDYFLDDSELLTNRQSIGFVQFAEGSSFLTQSAKETIDLLIPSLRIPDPQSRLIRIEGFASPTGGEVINFPLSMARARVVWEYIRQNYEMDVEMYMTGFGGKATHLTNMDQSCRAEIALYDNIWEEGNSPK